MVQVSSGNMRLLEQLQGLDMEISRIEDEKASIPPEISALLRKIESLRKSLEELTGETGSLAAKRRESEHVLDDKLSVLEKLRSQKNLVSTNEAYTALLKEIEAAEHEQSQAEEDILMFMERAEELLKAADRKKEDIGRAEAELAGLKERNRARVEKLEAELSSLLSRREGKAAEVEPGLFGIYDRTRRSRSGPVFVAVEKGACTGCSMELRAQVISELMKGEVLICEGCARLIYLPGEAG